MPTTIRCENVTVQYGSLTALNDVSFSLEPSKIHVLVGQNGAGKSSLARVLSGLISPAQGRFWIGDKQIDEARVENVRAAGLDIVHQRFTLPAQFTIAEALELSSAKKQTGSFFSFGGLQRAWSRELEAAGIPATANTLVQDLPVEVTQSLEILRALANDAEVLILDEPTALLSPDAIDGLFERIRHLKADGVTLLVVLHKLREVMEIADTVMVLREGELVLPPTPAERLTAGEISDLMIGEAAASDRVSQVSIPSATPRQTDHKPRLDLANVHLNGTETEPALIDISFQIQPGEVVGIAGIGGNGQRNLVSAITGQAMSKQGRIELLEQDVTKLTPIARRQTGLRVVPFDRMTEGSSLELPLWENVMTWQAESFVTGWLPWLPVKKIRQAAEDALNRFGVVYSSLDQPAGSLSGGNLQRLILARELASDTKVVIAAQPTRGLDFQATDFVWQVLGDLSRDGAGVLLISSDLDELFQICDRILVMRAGQIAGEFSPPYSAQAVGDAMTGTVR